jgi:PadR family transcriptional regulator, regulatory protein AphA
MSLRPILLGLLEFPASGYDLRKSFEETVRHFWSAELSQIYPTLHQLYREGLVKMSSKTSRHGPKRKVYSRTVAGTRELRRWVMGGPIVETERFSWLGQLFFMGQVADPAETRRFIEDLRSHLTRRLEILRAIDEHHRRGADRPPDLDGETLHPYLTLLCGLKRTAATIEWCDDSLEMLASLQSKQRR